MALSTLQKLINVIESIEFRSLPPQAETLINAQSDKSLESIKIGLEKLPHSEKKNEIIVLIDAKLKSKPSPGTGFFSRLRGGKSRRRRPRRNRKSRKNSWWF
jgi:hypothetical protein